MRMRRHQHSENPLDVVRSMLTKGSPTAALSKPELLDVRNIATLTESTADVLFEQMDGKKASTETEPCKVCGAVSTSKVRIPRQKKDPINRCGECGKHTGPGANTVRGSTNYTGSPGSFYDESSK